MKFQDLTKPISEMSREERLDFIKNLRSQRVAKKTSPKKRKQKKAKVDKLAKMLEEMSPEEKENFLKGIGG